MNAADLPDDVEALKAHILRQEEEKRQLQAEHEATLEAKTRQLQAEHEARDRSLRDEYEQQITGLREQVNLLLAKRFGTSSEQLSPNQLRLFCEPVEKVEPGLADDDTVEVPAHRRAKRGRRPLPDSLPRVEVIHDLADREKVCPKDGTALELIGEGSSEQLDIVPAKVQVIRHIRRKYACPCCEQHVKTAPMPAQPIPKSTASPGMLAHVATSKYVDALPLYRQEAIFQRMGVDIPRATFANWMIQCGQLIQPLINLMREQLLAGPMVQMDETPVQVVKEPAKSAQSKSWIWVSRGGPPRQPLVLYDYDPGRGKAVPQRLLDGYQGYLQTDGYKAYREVGSQGAIIHVGCWAHARRKFDEANKAQGRGKKPAGRAMQGLAYIQKLYRIERALKEAIPKERHAQRQEQARPVLEQLRAWLDKSLPQVPPQSAVGKALNYLHEEWPRLIRYLDDGLIPIDNNLTENAIRPFTVGRKNWLFSDSVKGIESGTNLYSLIQTAKANRLEPYQYLRHVFTELPKADTVEAIEALLPANIDVDLIYH